VEKSGRHVSTGGVPHTLVEPENVADERRVKWLWLGGGHGEGGRESRSCEISKVEFVEASTRVLASAMQKLVVIEQTDS